jgi:hypothetical protein
MNDGNDESLCGRIILDKTMIVDDVELVTCPQCLQKMHEEIEGKDHG